MVTFSPGSDVSDCGLYEVGPGDTPVPVKEGTTIMNSVTLRQNDSINLTTGVVTRSDQRSEMISYPTGLAAAVRRNNLRALHLAIQGSVCGWTPEACHRSQAAHGRGDDCEWHPWSKTPPLSETPYAERVRGYFPGVFGK